MNDYFFFFPFSSINNGIDQYSPVEPFGGTNDYAVSEEYIVYTAKDPDLPEAWHTKQNVRTPNPVSE